MILLIAFGNPGRGDDGLGPALAERLEAKSPQGVHIVVDYQLTVEHALLLSNASEVVFVDAEVNAASPYTFTRVSHGMAGDVTSHSLSPKTVLTLAKVLYGAAPPAFVLGIAGFEFGEVREGLSPSALRNLNAAEEFLLDWLSTPASGRADSNLLPATGS